MHVGNCNVNQNVLNASKIVLQSALGVQRREPFPWVSRVQESFVAV